MQALKLEIEDSKVNIVLNIIDNLKDDIIKSYEIVNISIDEEEYIKGSETLALTTTSANSIEDWKDKQEDEIWV